MRRRDFLTRTLLGATLLELLSPRVVEGEPGPIQHTARRRRRKAPTVREPIEFSRIGVSTSSFRDYFSSTSRRQVEPEERLVLLDFSGMIAERYKVHNVEFAARHFASTEPTYFEELKSALARARSQLTNITLDIPEIQVAGGLSDPNPNIRNAAIQAVKKWIDVAKAFGGRSVSCDPGTIDPENPRLTIDSCKTLAAYGRSKGVDVLIEDRGTVSSTDPEDLVKLFKTVGSRFLGALPDFDAFPDESARARGLTMLFPYARTVCHAQGLAFDATGRETQVNFQTCVEIAKRAKYKGVYSIEYLGPDNPYSGVEKVLSELVRYLLPEVLR